MIAQSMATVRMRMRDIVVRRQRGLPAADDELDVLVRALTFLDTLDEVVLNDTVDPKKPRSKRATLEDVIGQLEDAAYEAESNASDIRHTLSSVRKALAGLEAA